MKILHIKGMDEDETFSVKEVNHMMQVPPTILGLNFVSSTARLAWIRIASLPSLDYGWRVITNGFLAKSFAVTQTQVRRILRELQQAGILDIVFDEEADGSLIRLVRPVFCEGEDRYTFFPNSAR